MLKSMTQMRLILDTMELDTISQIADVITGLRDLNIKKPKDFDEQISRYSCFMCFAILAAAAEGDHFNSARKLKELILGSFHKEEIEKALAAAGFEFLGVYGGYDMSEPDEKCERWYFVARAKK